MCITFLYTNSSDESIKFKLILINNRDEFYRRKTLKASVKTENDLIKIYGTDIETEVVGTWLALSKNRNKIRIGNLLNVPGEIVTTPKVDLKGRGPISLDYISSEDKIEDFNRKLCDICTSYNSFNFLSVEMRENEKIKTFFTSNSNQSVVEIEENFIGASNSPIDAPLKKVLEGKKKFIEIVEKSRTKSDEKLIEELMELLKWDKRHYPDEELFKRRGNDAEMFSSIHVRGNDLYGTRTHTIILVHHDNKVEYIEDTMINTNPHNSKWETTRFEV